MRYLISLPGLDAAVERTAPSPKHTALLAALRRFEPLATVKLAAERDGYRLSRRKVLDTAGAVVAEDHEAWLASEAQKDGGRVRATADRLRVLNYHLSECALEKLYLIADHGGEQDNFIQVEIELRHERVVRRLFDERGGYRTLQDLDDLVRLAEEEGDRIPDEQQATIGRDHYELECCVDVRAFMRDAEALKVAEHERGRQGKLLVTDMEIGPDGKQARRYMTIDEINPNAKHWVWPPRRLFIDWTASSAGRAGHRLSDHWALDIRDYTSPNGERDVSVIPLWTHTRKMAKIESAPNVHTLLGKLQSIDTRRGVNFAWFFYMLHGNLVRDWAGERILKAAKDGLIVLPEHDYQVLRRWEALPYGF